MPADMDRIMEIPPAYCVRVVTDAAAALGALFKGRAIGAQSADLTVFFNGNTTVPAGSSYSASTLIGARP